MGGSSLASRSLATTLCCGKFVHIFRSTRTGLGLKKDFRSEGALTISLLSHNFENALLLLPTKTSFVSTKFTTLSFEGVQANVGRSRFAREHKRKNLVFLLQ
jgi:hypothetical protein